MDWLNRFLFAFLAAFVWLLLGVAYLALMAAFNDPDPRLVDIVIGNSLSAAHLHWRIRRNSP